MASCPGSAPGRPTGTAPQGRYDPARGMRFNPAKLLLDPYARAMHGTVQVRARRCSVTRPATRTRRAHWTRPAHVPRSLVVHDDASPVATATAPRRRYADTVIYEVHVKGFTMRHPGVPAELRGTYAGLGHEAAIGHLLDLGRDRRRAAAGA